LRAVLSNKPKTKEKESSTSALSPGEEEALLNFDVSALDTDQLSDKMEQLMNFIKDKLTPQTEEKVYQKFAELIAKLKEFIAGPLDDKGTTILHATAKKYLTQARLYDILVKEGAVLEATTAKGYTPLWTAALNAEKKAFMLISILTKLGANPNYERTTKTGQKESILVGAFRKAINKSDDALWANVGALLRAKANPNVDLYIEDKKKKLFLAPLGL